MAGKDREVWTEAEVHLAIEGMSHADLLRLQQIAQGLVKWNGSRLDPDELLNEAMAKALEGCRTVPKAVRLVTVLAGMMRSIVFNERKRHDNSRVDQVDPAELVDFADDKTPEQDVIDRELKQKLLDLFKDDEAATLIVEGTYFDGIPAQELRELIGLGKAAFESKKKAVLRAIRRAAAKGEIT